MLLLKTYIWFNIHCQEYFYFSKNWYCEFRFLASQRLTHLPISVHMTLSVRRISMYWPLNEKTLLANSLKQGLKQRLLLLFYIRLTPVPHLIRSQFHSHGFAFHKHHCFCWNKKYSVVLIICNVYWVVFYQTLAIIFTCSRYSAFHIYIWYSL